MGGRPRIGLFVAIAGALALAGTTAVAHAQPAKHGTSEHAKSPSVRELLLSRPLAPKDPKRLDPFLYPQAPPVTPPNGSDISEAQGASMLASYEADEFPHNSAEQQAAVAVYNDATAKAKVPSPTLRAALAALTGTFAEPAIGFILHGTRPDGHPYFTDVRWAPISAFSSPGFLAESRFSGDDQYIQFNDAYRGENPFLYVGTMAHEPLHSDQVVYQTEEAVNHSLDKLVFLHQLVRHPWLAHSGHAISRFYDTQAMLRLNGGKGPKLGLFDSNGDKPLATGSRSGRKLTRWVQFYTSTDQTPSPGNPLLQAYLNRIDTGPGQPCSGAEFDVALLHCIDREGDAGLTQSDLLADMNVLLNTHVDHKRTVTLFVGKSSLTGKVTSRTKACAAKQTVVLERIHRGKATRVGSAQTAASGRYALKRHQPKGHYQAVLNRRLIPGTGICDPARSS